MTTPHPKVRVDGRYKTLRIDLHHELVFLSEQGELSIRSGEGCVVECTMSLELHNNPVPLLVTRGLAYDPEGNVVLPMVQCVIELRRQVEALKPSKPGG